jgi:hypothetical protein
MRKCSSCKEPFEPQTKGQRFCWRGPCRNLKLGPRKRVKAKTTTEAGYNYEYRKNRPLALERDGWICQMPICKAPTREIHRDAPRGRHYPSADHIIPPSRGGTAALENLRASHLGCNSSAGATRGNRERGQGRVFSSRPRIV